MQPTKRRILCVDDDEDTCFMLTHLLEQENYEVRTVKTVSEALELARNEGDDAQICRTDQEAVGHHLTEVKCCNWIERLRQLYGHHIGQVGKPTIYLDGHSARVKMAKNGGAKRIKNHGQFGVFDDGPVRGVELILTRNVRPHRHERVAAPHPLPMCE